MKRIASIRPLISALVLGAFFCALCPVTLYAQDVEAATQSLLTKAHALELRGRMDMAAQTWRQVLLADPNNVEAIAGLARTAKLNGDATLSGMYLDRLRAINPNDANIARVENMDSQASRAAQLQQAAKLAQTGQNAQAMQIYRQIFGDTPPAGEWALTYYETESATEAGRPHAIAGLQTLVQKNPADSRYQIALGRILTYNPNTRAEGRQYLERYPDDAQAVAALRQALAWDSSNPAVAVADLHPYAARQNGAQPAQAQHNQPKPNAASSLQTEKEIAEAAALRSRDNEEAAAYSALNAENLPEAERRFQAILAKEPGNASALAGMGYVRMQQSNFSGAVSYLEQSKQNGARDKALDDALESCQFYSVTNHGSTALNEGDLTAAEQQYRAGLVLRPSSADALEGLGSTLLKAQQPAPATEIYQRFIDVKPAAPAAWRGLFTAQFGAGNAPQALMTERRMPIAVRSQLMRDPDFLRSLAAAYSAVGRDVEAQQTLRAALELPLPSGVKGLQTEIQLQYAALLQQANRPEQAAAIFTKVLQSNPSNIAAWQQLLRILHMTKQDPQALQTLNSMPASSHEAAMRDTGFEATVAAIFQRQNKLDAALEILEKSVAQQTAAGQKPSTAFRLQLAGVYLAHNNPQKALPIYREVLSEGPDHPGAWKVLLSILHTSGHDQDALAQIQQIPPTARSPLEDDVEYLQTVGAIYNSLGQPQQAATYINRVQQLNLQQRAAPPADIDIQYAWLLFNEGNDAGLYHQLMLLGGRHDLSDEQRSTTQTIWANWAVRRARQSAAAGNTRRSLAILDAAAHSFPDNPGVLRALASEYLRADLPQQAVVIFQSQDMTAATASDYKSAVGAALAAGDMKNAEIWLHLGLDTYPKDAGMLRLGARFEQGRGNDARAIDSYHASLAAQPSADPSSELAAELSQPQPTGNLPSPGQPQDLATLLSGSNQEITAQNAAPPPPSPASSTNASGQTPVQAPGSSNVVPSYMTNPSDRSGQQAPSNSSTLGNPVPQSSNSQPPIDPSHDRNGTTPAQAPAEPSHSPASQPAELASQGTAHPVQQAQSQPLNAAPQQEVYGAYVPYIPPVRKASHIVSAQPADDLPRPTPSQRVAIDVQPTARYVPKTQTGSGSVHADVYASPHRIAHEQSHEGQSNPPAEDYATSYIAQPPPSQHPQPSQQPGDSFGQQYPQPPPKRPSQPAVTSANTFTPP
jgi:tetratricopeptide (TPR) repeat protein